jgi:hypothetical protein
MSGLFHFTKQKLFMTLDNVTRKQTMMHLALMGPSGSGKTYSSLLLAHGICGDLSKVAIIDTQDRSASLYSHLGSFTTIHLGAPFHPERFYEAIALCEASEKEVIIIDTLSSEWVDEGGVIDRLSGNHYEDALRAHRMLLNVIRNSSAHIICNIRTKQKLVRVDRNGKLNRELVQMPVQQEGIEYIFTTVFSLDRSHKAHVIKDRTSLFTCKAPLVLNEEQGSWIYKWCKQGEPLVREELQDKINNCFTMRELYQLLFKEEIDNVEIISAFTKRRLELEAMNDTEKSALGKEDDCLKIIGGGVL